MRIATWNINSVRARIDLVIRLIDERAPDTLCLQETKTVDGDFPLAPFLERGYVHNHIHGMKAYNGVAILSRLPLTDLGVENWCGREDRRHIRARLPGGTELHCLYVPAGGDVPDPVANDKFAHKLEFLAQTAKWFAETRKPTDPMILVGDLNVAPLECDVWNHKALLDVVCHTPVETEALERLRAATDWVDAVRLQAPAPERIYSWWSYRARDWSTADKGRRIDHVWVTPPLAGALKGWEIARDARGWEPKPSDHAPVIVDLA